MKQVVQNLRSGDLGVWDVPPPMLRRGGLLVATSASLISAGTEKMVVDLGKANLAAKAAARPDLVKQVIDKARREGVAPTMQAVFSKLDSPVALGYSLAGQVIEVGDDVHGFRAGDRVACAGAGYASHAEIVFVPKNLVARIPDRVSDEDASFVTVGAIALQGVRQAQPTLGERVVVLGLGLIGQLTIQLLKANGCRVLGYDPDKSKQTLALKLGADAVASSDLDSSVAAFTDGVGADAVVITASTKSDRPVNDAARISRSKGRVVVVGAVGMKLDRDPFYRKELDLRLSMSYGPGRYDPAYEEAGHDYPLPFVRWTEQRNMTAFLELVAGGQVTPGKLISHRFAVEHAQDAYALFDSDEPYLGICLTYPNASGAKDRIVAVSERRSPASEGRVAFIGAGSFAKAVLLPALKKVPGITLRTVITSTGVSARHTAERFGFAFAATDVEAVLDDPDTDAVFIATRHDTHSQYVAEALKRGKHVFCEKPLAIDEEGLQAVIEAHGSSDRQLVVGFNRRHSPLVRQALQALTAQGPRTMLFRVNAGVVPKDSWVHGLEGGGRIIGEVCHFVDTLMAFTSGVPERVQAIAARGHEDALTIQIGFTDGSVGTILYSSLGDKGYPKEYMEIFAAGQVVAIDDFRRLTISQNGGRKTRTLRAQAKGHKELVAAFADSIRRGAAPVQRFDDTVAVTRATFAIREATQN